MEHLPKNGYFMERRKMFVGAPFHNLYSNVPLDWKGEEKTTDEAERPRRKHHQEVEKVRQIYEQSVQERMNRRLTNLSHYNTIEEEIFRRKKNEDALSKQLEMFTNSKVLMTHQVPEGSVSQKSQNKQTIQHEEAPFNTGQNAQKNEAYLKTSHTKGESKQSFRKEQFNRSQKMPTYDQPPLYMNPELKNGPTSPMSNSRETHPMGSSGLRYQIPREYSPSYQLPSQRYRQNSPPQVQDRYQSLQNPYYTKNYGRQIQELYTGVKPQQYPFRNVIPDKLQNYLRERTKADRRRSYQVSLNLFKH